MASLHSRNFAEAPKGAASISGECLFGTNASPEPVVFADTRARLERSHDKREQRYGSYRLLPQQICGSPTCG
jgi:hypothetical protein